MSLLQPIGCEFALLDAATQSVGILFTERLTGTDTWVSAVMVENGNYDIRNIVRIADNSMSYQAAHFAHINARGKTNADHFLAHVAMVRFDDTVDVYLEGDSIGSFILNTSEVTLEPGSSIRPKATRIYQVLQGVILDYLQSHRDNWIGTRIS